MTLALLLTVTTGAWADELSESFTTNTRASVYTGEHFKITVGDVGDGGGFYLSDTKKATIEALNGEIINKVEFTKGFYDINNFYCEVGTTNISGNVATVSGVNKTSLSFTASSALQIKAVKVYYTAIEVNPVAEPAANTKQWTFNQPGGDVVLTPIYAKAAEFATESTSSGVTLLAPAAAEGVIAGTDAPLIVEGTGIVATTMIGETPTAQGTVMYAVTAATATKAPELDAADTWSADVPTAEDVADDGAEVKVWYYILGADAPDGVAATLDNTFNNSEVSSLTVSVLSNKFDLTLKAANANTIDANQTSKGTVSVKEGDAAVDKTKAITDGKLEAVKMGSEVKLNTKAGYKFRKVEVKKTVPVSLTDATTEGAVTRIKFNYGGNVYYADFTYSNGSFTRTGGSNGYNFSGSWTMKEENGVLTMTADYNESGSQYIYFVCTFYADTNEYTAKSTGSWNYSFKGIEVNGTDITSQLTKVK